MKVVIFGSGSIGRLEEVEKAVEASGVLPRTTEIVSGCAAGVDTLALAYAEKHNLPVKLFPARWDELGLDAGLRRNIEMAAYADFGVAVWDGQSPGTAHMIGLMEDRVFVWRVDDVDDSERLVITAPTQVAALKAIYDNCGPEAQVLAWDFSRPGRVVLPQAEAGGRHGFLNYLNLKPCSWPRPWPEALPAALASADFDIHLFCGEGRCDEPSSAPETEESQEALATAARPADGPEAERPGPPTKDPYKDWDQVTDPTDAEVLKVFYQDSGLKRTLEELHNFDAELLADPLNNWIFLESGAVVGCGLGALEGRLTELNLLRFKDRADIKGLKRLDLLAGLTALRELSLDLDWLADGRPLAGPASLEKLILRGSRKTSQLPSFSGLARLKKLDLSRLSLKSLAPVATLTALEELNLPDNVILQNLEPLAGLASLKRLDLRYNKISDLEPLTGLAALEDLELDGNRFMALGPLTLGHLSRLTELKTLSLPDNKVHDLAPLAGLTALKKLDLHNNQIDDLSPLAGLTGLEELNLSGNQIRDLSPLAGLASLKRLELCENEISDLRPLAGLTALEALWLGDNQVGDLEPLAGLTALKKLEASHNRLTDLSPLAVFTALTELKLEANQIISLEPLARLTELHHLCLSYNRVNDLRPLAGLGYLKILDLDSNQIEDLAPLAGLSALEVLNLANNRVRDLSPLAGLTALVELNLENNEITALPDLPGLSVTESLSLGGNPLQDIRALEKISRSAQDIFLRRGRSAMVSQTRPEPTGPEAAPTEPRKLLILDLDGTLWGGQAADCQIYFGRRYGRDGRAYLAFQRQIKALARQGLLLAVCSLNDPHLARLPFQTRGDMPLALGDFAAFKANWREKADNILDISRELGLPFREMVFVDNDRNQRMEVRRRLPEVAVPELPDDPGRYIQALKRGGWLNNYFEAAGSLGVELEDTDG